MSKSCLGYACKYTPVELFAGFGVAAELIDSEEDDFELAESLTHANICCHAKAMLQETDNYNSVVIADCCDSLRRVYDVLYDQNQLSTSKNACIGLNGDEKVTATKQATQLEEASSEANNDRFLYLMDLPHEANECSIERFTHELCVLSNQFAQETGREFSRTRFIQAWQQQSETTLNPNAINQPFFAVMGARTSPELLQLIQDSLQLPVINLTCSGNRHLDAPPADAATIPLEALMQEYAQALLHMLPCMRMADITSRRQLIEHPNLAGIIYNTVKFCDFYNFDYDDLRTSTNIPILKIESDYMPSPAGQITTRLEAFAESNSHITAGSANGFMGSATNNPNSQTPSLKEASMPHPSITLNSLSETTPAINPNGRYVAGIDSGSTTTNMVVLAKDGTEVAHAIVRTGAKAQNGAHAALQTVCKQLGANIDDFAFIMATGYGRFNIPFATDTKTEITCHARGVHHLDPSIRTIVDIGGQDSKVICLDKDGSVSNFIMNDKCAAGTGRFLEAMARTLEIDLDHMSTTGLTWDKDLTISSMCTVFAESEVISLIADNHSEQDIVHGLNKSIASRTASMVKRAKGEPPFMMTGGVARNRGVVEELERKLNAPLAITQNPDLCGALGAALFAHDACK